MNPIATAEIVSKNNANTLILVLIKKRRQTINQLKIKRCREKEKRARRQRVYILKTSTYISSQIIPF